VPSGEQRRALGERKERRPHPASPEAAELAGRAADAGLVAGQRRLNPLETPVMFCVRVPASLRQRVKLAALRSGRTVQEFATDALQSVCRDHESRPCVPPGRMYAYMHAGLCLEGLIAKGLQE